MSAGKKNNVHTISLLVANKPGVLVRCAQVFARRGFNIDALVVSPSVNPKYSRMTVTAQGDVGTLEQIIKQTSKLIDVIHCGEHVSRDAIDREFALIKVKCSAKSKKAIVKVTRQRSKIAYETDQYVIVEQKGTTDELDKMEQDLKRFGIIEMVRSGKLVIAKEEAT